MAGEQTTTIGIDYEAILRAYTYIRSCVGDDEYRNRCDKDGTRRPRAWDTWQMTAVNSDGGEYKLKKKIPAAVSIRIMLYKVIYTHFETQKREDWTGLDVVTLYYYRASAYVFVFFYIHYTVSKLIWTHRERSHARLMEFYSALETFFLGLYYAPASPVYIGTHVLIGMTTTTLDILISASFTRLGFKRLVSRENFYEIPIRTYIIIICAWHTNSVIC